jgi:LPXTG-motif cell wall-anchored protein
MRKSVKGAVIGAVTTAVVASVTGLSAPTALAETSSTIPGNGWVSTQTVPDYILSDDGASVNYTPGTVLFSTSWNPRFGKSWQDTYLVTGYSHGANSTDQAGSYGKYVYKMPLQVSSSSQFTGKMTYSVSPDFSGRPGWDIWLSPKGSQGVDTSASSLEANPRTVEILLQPGNESFESNPGYDRLFYGVGSLTDVNLGAYVQKGLAYLGLTPSDYYWAAVDGGVEMTQGSFTMNSYALSVTVNASDGSKTVKTPDWGATATATTHASTKKSESRPKVKAKPKTHAQKKLTVTEKIAPASDVTQPKSGTSVILYALIGLGILGLGVVSAVVWRRRRRRA